MAQTGYGSCLPTRGSLSGSFTRPTKPRETCSSTERGRQLKRPLPESFLGCGCHLHSSASRSHSSLLGELIAVVACSRHSWACWRNRIASSDMSAMVSEIHQLRRLYFCGSNSPILRVPCQSSMARPFTSSFVLALASSSSTQVISAVQLCGRLLRSRRPDIDACPGP
jgi:hypothetical protein